MEPLHKISMCVAVLIGLPLYFLMPDWTGFAFMYLFGIACGGAGSRLAAIARKGI